MADSLERIRTLIDEPFVDPKDEFYFYNMELDMVLNPNQRFGMESLITQIGFQSWIQNNRSGILFLYGHNTLELTNRYSGLSYCLAPFISLYIEPQMECYALYICRAFPELGNLNFCSILISWICQLLEYQKQTFHWDQEYEILWAAASSISQNFGNIEMLLEMLRLCLHGLQRVFLIIDRADLIAETPDVWMLYLQHLMNISAAEIYIFVVTNEQTGSGNYDRLNPAVIQTLRMALREQLFEVICDGW